MCIRDRLQLAQVLVFQGLILEEKVRGGPQEVDQRRLADQHRVAAAFLFLSIDSNGAFISLFHGQRRLEIFLGLAALSVTVHKGCLLYTSW